MMIVTVYKSGMVTKERHSRMDKKTEGIEVLVKDVLATMPAPYGEDIILRVFQVIERNPDLKWRYQSLSNDLSDDFSNNTINKWIGKYVKDQAGLNSLRQVSAEGKCKLITSYTKLGR
jgi:hypothetical protein